MSKKSHSNKQPGKEPIWTVMTMEESYKRRDQFRRAVDAKDNGELTLLQKQAVIELMLQGKPITEIFYRPATGDDGKKYYLVIRGWYHLQAIFDFRDNKFPTWTAEEKERFMRGEEE